MGGVRIHLEASHGDPRYRFTLAAASSWKLLRGFGSADHCQLGIPGGWVLTIIAYHKRCKAFGHGIGLTIGHVIATGILTIILGFGKSQYTSISAEAFPTPGLPPPQQKRKTSNTA